MQVPLFLGFRSNTGIFALGSLVAFFIFIKLFRQHSLASLLPILLNRKFCLLVFGWVALGWLVLAVLKYFALDYYIWDVGIFANNLVNFVETGIYFSSVLNMHGFADHFSPNLLLLAPLFKIAPSVMWLVFLKVVAFFVTTWLLFRLGITLLGKQSQWIYLAPILWVSNKYFAQTLEAEFQPSSLTPPFIVAAFWFVSQKKYRSMLICLVILLGFKEHLSLIWLSVGGFLLGEKNFKMGLFCIGAGLLTGIVTYFVIMPFYFEGIGAPLHTQSRFGIFELVPRKLEVFGWCLLSVGLLPLIQWKNWLMILPAFGLTWVTNDPPMLNFGYYYFDISMTVVVVSVIYSVKKFQTETSHPQLPVSVLWGLRVGMLMSILLVNTYTPQQWIVRRIPSETHAAILKEIQQYREELGMEKELWLDDQIGIHFIRFPQMRYLPMGGARSYQLLLNAQKPRSVVFLKDPILSNLTSGLHPHLVADLEKLTQQGCYQKRSEFKNLLVYEATRRCS